MKVLITGATGLIGREVGKLLAAAGHEITVVSRRPALARLQLPFPATVLKWEGEDAPFPVEAVAGQNAIVHLAGEPIAAGRWTEERKRHIRDSRVLGTRRLVEAVRSSPEARHSLRVFVQASAIGIYGDRGDEILTEDAGVGDDFLARVVVDWEKEAEALLASDGLTGTNPSMNPSSGTSVTENLSVGGLANLRLCLVRMGIVLSRHGGALDKMLPVFSKGLGGKLAAGQQWMSWIHIDDAARIFAFCVESEVGDRAPRGAMPRSMPIAINAVAPEPARNERFTIELARALGASVFLPVPETALKAAFGEMSVAVLGSQRVSSARVREMGFEFRHPGLVEALREIGEPLRDGQHEMLQEQWVPRPPDAVFSYFGDEANLERITPPFLGFRVLGKSTPDIRQGTLIDYRLRLHGLPFKWRTRIDEWRPGERFVDVQLKGPYRKWHHTHEFIPFAGGTLLRDRVIYQLPMGVLGDVFAGWKVSRDVESIFAYRREKIGAMFN